MRLAITDTYKPTFQLYVDWLKRSSPDVEIVTLSCIKQNLHELNLCDGLVLTGGGDIHPKFYGREDAMLLVHDLNEARDEFEFSVVERANNQSLPILGICRGMQLFNVALGGTMIPDVRAAGYLDHNKPEGATVEQRHGVQIEAGTFFCSIVGLEHGEVNTSHHQAVDKLGRGLKATAYSPDGLVEGLEWEHGRSKPFLQLVQWHPERMTDFESPLSRGLLDSFIHEVRASKNVETP